MNLIKNHLFKLQGNAARRGVPEFLSSWVIMAEYAVTQGRSVTSSFLLKHAVQTGLLAADCASWYIRTASSPRADARKAKPWDKMMFERALRQKRLQ